LLPTLTGERYGHCRERDAGQRSFFCGEKQTQEAVQDPFWLLPLAL